MGKPKQGRIDKVERVYHAQGRKAAIAKARELKVPPAVMYKWFEGWGIAEPDRPPPKAPTIKDVVLDSLDTAIAEVSGNNRYRFNQRQLLYRLRPIIQSTLAQELTTGNYAQIITDYENENGEIPGMYREPRGSIYHPHRSETITLGTLMVEEYERPLWTFNKLVYIEKEGFSAALKDEKWAERHDCALMSSKGFSTRAARDLVDLLAEHDEPVTIFCCHDADGHGGVIYETFQGETKARGARKIEVTNLGLEPWEALEMGLEVETFEPGDKRRPVAEYVRRHPCPRSKGSWEEWLQSHRVELNAMTTPEFIAWLDGKMAAYAKLIPPVDVVENELAANVENKLRDIISERILREAGLENQVAAALAAIDLLDGATLQDGITELFEDDSTKEWRDHIEAVAARLTEDL